MSNTRKETVLNESEKDIFERLLNGESISSKGPHAYKLREAAFATMKLLLQMNNTSQPTEIRNLLSQITDSEIDESVTIFTPFHINYGRQTKIGKNVFINFDCVFLDLGAITIDENVLIGPKVSLLTEGHPIEPSNRHSLTVGHIHIKKKCVDWCRSHHLARCHHWRKCSCSGRCSCFKRRSG
jgi:hypothetical protein